MAPGAQAAFMSTLDSGVVDTARSVVPRALCYAQPMIVSESKRVRRLVVRMGEGDDPAQTLAELAAERAIVTYDHETPQGEAA